MEEIIVDLINQFGYLSIAFLICIENIFPPIPSEVILLFGGFMATRSNLNEWMVIIFATIGSTLGAIALYGLGRVLKKERLKILFDSKFGKLVGLKSEYVDKADIWFIKYEYKAVLICRCIPIVRSFISVPAGISKMKLGPFMGLTILGSSVWNTMLVWMGSFAGESWEEWLAYIGIYSKVILVILVLVILIGGIVFYRFKKKTKEN